MNSGRISWVLAAGVVTASLVAPVGPATAEKNSKPTEANHDGVYAVQIITQRGSCDKSYLWTISISGGHISSTGDTPMEAAGEVNRQGVVSFAFRRFNDIAHVSGKVSGRQGSGTWSSPTMSCAGTWRATRQS